MRPEAAEGKHGEQFVTPEMMPDSSVALEDCEKHTIKSATPNPTQSTCLESEEPKRCPAQGEGTVERESVAVAPAGAETAKTAS